MLVARLTRKTDYDRIFRRGEKIRGPIFLLAARASGDTIHRVGFVAGRDVGGAVKRNRARRLMREAFRHNIEGCSLQAYELVFVARKEINAVAFRAIETECRRRLLCLSRRRYRNGGGSPSAPDQSL